MTPDSRPSWSTLRETAAARLPEDFSTRILRRAGEVRRRRRETLACSFTLTACLLATGLLYFWPAYQENEENLAQWQTLAALTEAVDYGL